MRTLFKNLWLMCVFALCTSSTLATTYTYVGQPMDNGKTITGSFTTNAPLEPSLTDVDVGPLGTKAVIAWTFTDGSTVLDQTNSYPYNYEEDSFIVSTDVDGKITGFIIFLIGPKNPGRNPDDANMEELDITSYGDWSASKFGCAKVDPSETYCTKVYYYNDAMIEAESYDPGT